MAFLRKADDSELRAKVQLIRAYMQSKSTLSYQINQLKIRNSYRQSNTDFRDFKDMGNISKLLHKKLQDVQSLNTLLRSPEIQKHPSTSVSKLVEIIVGSEGNMKDIDKILGETMNSEVYLSLLKEKYLQVKETLNGVKAVHRENVKKLEQNQDKQEAFEALEEEVNELASEVETFQKENKEMLKKKQRITINRRGSVQRIKVYQQLSDSALKLRSKLVFKDELERNIRSANLEIQQHSEKIEKEKVKLQLLQGNSEASLKFNEKYENDLYELRKETKRLEIKLEILDKEREKLIQQCKEESERFELPKNSEDTDETLSINLIGLLNGFNEMRKEKDSLIAENDELKRKISNLFRFKV